MARILIIDDEAILAKAIRRVALRLGHEAALAPTLAAGERLCETFAPELVLLDLGLPDGYGMDLLARLAAGASPPGVVVMTAFSGKAKERRALELGAKGFLRKPLDMQEVAAAITAALEGESDRSSVRRGPDRGIAGAPGRAGGERG